MSDKGDDFPKDDPDAPPSADEVAASKRLRDALEGRGDADPLVSALQAAWDPAALDAGVHAEVLDEIPTAEELALAEELRAALESASPPDLVVSLESAWRPRDLSVEEHRAIVARAVGGGAKVIAFRPRAIRVVVVATTSALALAAGFVLWIASGPPREAPLAKARSTQPLFEEPFRAGEASARIDKIAIARASDYRDNRFAKWGVR